MKTETTNVDTISYVSWAWLHSTTNKPKNGLYNSPEAAILDMKKRMGDDFDESDIVIHNHRLAMVNVTVTPLMVLSRVIE